MGGSFLVLSDLMDFDCLRAFYLLSYHQPKISQAESQTRGAGICSECCLRLIKLEKGIVDV